MSEPSVQVVQTCSCFYYCTTQKGKHNKDPAYSTLREAHYKSIGQFAKGKIDGHANFANKEKSEITVSTSTQLDITATDRYSLNIVVIEDSVGPYYQNNYEPGFAEGFETSQVNMLFNDVAREIHGGLNGIAGSQFSNSDGEEEYTHSFNIQTPQNTQNPENLKLVALLTNTENGSIENAARISIGEYVPTGTGGAEESNAMTVRTGKNTIFVDSTECNETVEVYSSTGQLIYKGCDSEIPVSACGIYIVRCGSKAVIAAVLP